jgi:hypothetical protein
VDCNLQWHPRVALHARSACIIRVDPPAAVLLKQEQAEKIGARRGTARFGAAAMNHHRFVRKDVAGIAGDDP